MKVNRFKLICLALCSVFLVAFHSSLSNQTKHAKTVAAGSQFIEDKVDSAPRLKFTGGVRSILEDSKGNVWFGSHREGVCRFDGEKLSYFTVEDGLSSNQIRSIYEDSNGIVWFEGGEGISSFDGRKFTTHVIKYYSLLSLWQTGAHDLWFKGDESIGYNKAEVRPGVYRYDGKVFSYHVFPLPQTDNENFHYSVSTSFVKGKNQMLWFGTFGAAIGYNGSSFTVIDDNCLGFNEETGFLHIRSIFEDSKGNLWIGNNGIGVLLYDGDSTINFSETHGLISKNSARNGGFHSSPGTLEHVFAIAEDSGGNMWFGDRDTGAWCFDGKSFKNYTPNGGLPATHIWQIYNSKKGELWFAMDDGSVCKFNGESFERIF